MHDPPCPQAGALFATISMFTSKFGKGEQDTTPRSGANRWMDSPTEKPNEHFARFFTYFLIPALFRLEDPSSPGKALGGMTPEARKKWLEVFTPIGDELQKDYSVRPTALAPALLTPLDAVLV